MNAVKKVYCRGFQTVFRIALPILPYRNPKILKHLSDVPDLLKKLGKEHPLIVTDAMLSKLAVTKEFEGMLAEAGIRYSIYDGTEPNPTTQMVEDAFDIYQREGCDCLIALGGGSPMDCAKAVGVRAVYPKKPLGSKAGILKVQKKLPLLLAIPTTAGTGSEATLAAVIVDEKTRHKYVINSFPLIPHYTVLDAATIHTLPAQIAAATGMDALTHAVEAYIGRSTTRETRAYAIKAVKLIFANIEDAALRKNPDAEEKMLRASHLAGRAFTRSYVGYIHAVSHSLSGQYNMPHGLTNAVLLPIVLEMYGAAVYPKLARLSAAAGLGMPSEPDDVLAKRFIAAIYALNERLGIPDHIEGIDEKDIPKLSAYADKEANPLYPVPVLWDAVELRKIYRRAVNPDGQ